MPYNCFQSSFPEHGLYIAFANKQKSEKLNSVSKYLLCTVWWACIRYLRKGNFESKHEFFLFYWWENWSPRSMVCEIFFLLNLLKVHWALSIVFGQIESSVHKLLPQCKTTWGRQKYSESFAKWQMKYVVFCLLPFWKVVRFCIQEIHMSFWEPNKIFCVQPVHFRGNWWGILIDRLRSMCFHL